MKNSETLMIYSRATVLYIAGIVCLLIFMIANAAMAGEGASGGHSLIGNIALCMIVASAIGLLMKLLRQPIILGYLLAGVLIGPIGLGLITEHSDITTISELGLILLLFMIGLEIDLHKMLAAGKLVIIPGILQFPISLGVGYAVFQGLEALGVNIGGDFFTRLYYAIAIAISSTMIVVKLLYDKFELDTLPGRITVGILVFQDIWAIVVLAVQPNLSDPQVLGILQTFAGGLMLVAAALAASKYILPRVFKTVAKLPELLLVISMGWCFLVAAVAARPQIGLSMEMGALIAGISLATFPYSLDVIAKAVSIRDFFITLFFVGLGMQIPLPDVGIIIMALVLAAVLIFIRFFGVFGVLYPLKSGHRVSLLPTINLSQMSEFALVIAAMGVEFGHIQGAAVTNLIWVFSILAVASTYFVLYSHQIQKAASRLLVKIGLKDLAGVQSEQNDAKVHPILVLGFFRNASAMLAEVARQQPILMDRIKVVDFNPLVIRRLKEMGVACLYGDIANMDTLHHADIHHAKIVLSTIPDYILKGTSNLKLLWAMQKLCPSAKVILTAEGPDQARRLYEAGAHYVVQPAALTGANLVKIIDEASGKGLNVLREDAVKELETRSEVLS